MPDPHRFFVVLHEGSYSTPESFCFVIAHWCACSIGINLRWRVNKMTLLEYDCIGSYQPV